MKLWAKRDLVGRGLLLLTACVVAVLAMASTTPVAHAQAEWSGELQQAPTNLPPGGRGIIRVTAANVGDTQAAAFPTITVNLPPGVVLGDPPPNDVWTCTGAGTSTATCTNLLSAMPIPAFSYVGLASTPTGRWLRLSLFVDVAADAVEGAHPVDVTLDGGGSTVTQAHEVTIGPELPFGPPPGTFTAGAFDQSGADYTQGGGHPYEATASFDLNTAYVEPDPSDFSAIGKALLSKHNLKDVVVDLPPGFVGDPSATPKCPGLGDVTERTCPPASQVGVASVSAPLQSDGRRRMFAIYNIEPERGTPAQFAFFSPVGNVVMTPVVRSDGDMGISIKVKNVTQVDVITSTTATLWGVPADPSHDSQRCANPNFLAQACVGYDEANSAEVGKEDSYVPHSSGAPPAPFLTNPTECSGRSPVTRLHVASWENPGRFEADGDPDLSDARWVTAEALAPPVTNCHLTQFDPDIDVRPTTSTADAPSGLEFELKLPQNDDPDGLATAHLKDTRFVLPEGMRVNPAAADGLDACGSAQIGLVSKRPDPLRFTKLEPSCPAASKIGTIEVDTPLLDDPLTGDVFLARQTDNPFDSLLAIYMVVRGPGILVKLAGHVEADPVTGRLTTTVLANPQVPFDLLRVRLEGGPRAPLTTPAACGVKTAVAALTSWAGHSLELADSFTIDCTSDPNAFDPGFSAGSTRPVAGAFSPFVTRTTRNGGKELGGMEVSLPTGALARLRNVDVCTEAQLASSAGKAGRVTQGSPSCPAGSQIGTTTVGVGAGPTPFFPTIPGSNVSGRVFLTVPHTKARSPVPGARQAAYGLAVEVPAVAGPFDVGTVMVRAALYVDVKTGRVTAVTDKLPRILEGIPLDVRDVRVDIDRKGFTLNPSSCAEKRVAADISAQDGTHASRSSRFQMADCAALRFKPTLALRLTGRKQTKTGRHPGVKATVTQTGVGEAAIERAVVRLPKSLALDPDNAQALCEFADGTKDDLESHCPKGSIVGRARAVSPLLKRPLAGNVYFVKNVRIDRRTGNRIRTLPMIVVALRGEIAINLEGKSSTTKSGQLVNTFDGVPDAPISRFNLNIKGGRDGILTVTRTREARIDLCAKPKGHRAAVSMGGQNGKRRDFTARVKTPCAKKRGAARR